MLTDFFEAFAAGFLGIIGIVLFALSASSSLSAILLKSAGDWGVLALVWSIMTVIITLMRRVLERKDHPFSFRDLHRRVRHAFTPISAVALICFILSFISFISQLAGRPYERLTAIGCFVNALTTLLFVAAHAQTKHVTGHTVSSHIRARHPLIFWIICLPIGLFLGTLFFLLHIFATYQSVGLASDFATFKPQGELWAVGGDYSHKLHVYCTGEKKNASDPLVWIEHGLGGQHFDLTWVQRNMSTYARVCSYDHAGYGFSEPGPVPRDTFQIVDELRNLLITNNITDDLFFVGHSMAGFNTRVAQRLVKNKVRGFVLADPVSYLDYPVCEEGKQDQANALYNFGVTTAPFGFARLLATTPAFPSHSEISQLPDAKNYFANIVNLLSQALRVSELVYWPTSCGYTKRILNNGTSGSDLLGDIPFGLISAGGDGAVNSPTLFNVSTVFLHANVSAASHVGLVMDPTNAATIIDVANKIWNKAVHGIQW